MAPAGEHHQRAPGRQDHQRRHRHRAGRYAAVAVARTVVPRCAEPPGPATWPRSRGPCPAWCRARGLTGSDHAPIGFSSRRRPRDTRRRPTRTRTRSTAAGHGGTPGTGARCLGGTLAVLAGGKPPGDHGHVSPERGEAWFSGGGLAGGRGGAGDRKRSRCRTCAASLAAASPGRRSCRGTTAFGPQARTSRIRTRDTLLTGK
jgi:hypothetical protein